VRSFFVKFLARPLDRRKDEDPNDGGPERRQERAERRTRIGRKAAWLDCEVDDDSDRDAVRKVQEMFNSMFNSMSHMGIRGRLLAGAGKAA
jgi:hypothetical protein